MKEKWEKKFVEKKKLRNQKKKIPPGTSRAEKTLSPILLQSVSGLSASSIVVEQLVSYLPSGGKL